jgi:hypothetical protein
MAVLRESLPSAGRLVRALAALVGAGLALPASAAAHPVSGIDYQFPLPLWLYAAAGGVAVAASVPAAARSDRGGEGAPGRDRYRAVRRGVWTGLRVLVLLLLAEAIVAGAFGSGDFTTNPMTILTWVDFWVGLGIVSVLAGPVWDLVNPLALLGRAMDRDRPAPLRYPQRLGRWPAAALLLAWSWLELSWPGGSEPYTLTLIVLLYLLAQALAMAMFGGEVWLERGELFTVFSRTLARAAPLEWYVREPPARCPAELDHRGDRERAGCVACWLAAPRRARGLRLRWPARGSWREPPFLPGGDAFVVLLLSTVLYDGFRDTTRYVQLAQWILGRAPSLSGTELRTITMALCLAVLVGAFLVAMALIGLREGGLEAAVSRYAPTLVPIAGVYFVAHYLLYLVSYGQLTWKVIVDPFETDWVPDIGVWTGYPAGAVWAFQVVVIVLGHIVAVFAAHRVATREHDGRLAAVRAQTPLITLMIAYTVGGLWILGQTYQAL